MDLLSTLSIGGSVASLVGMLVSLQQAKSARRASNEAKSVFVRVQLTSITERLKAAQEHIREIEPSKLGKRGFNPGAKVDLIRREFDTALSSLPKSGVGSASREVLFSAQAILNSYNSSISNTPSDTDWQKLQISVQNAISELSSEATNSSERG
ncbi:hypothetical protein [Antarctobacter jejuensis]|uniref:hypothetical protein n=1 Tax=Antarctobacter jejuensis TaxID=1439938 RepID=UPI003FD45AAF